MAPGLNRIIFQLSTALLIVLVAWVWRSPLPPPLLAPALDPSMTSQLSPIEHVLVTPTNPARTATEARLDHERCAALHNHLVEYGWLAAGFPPSDIPRRSFFNHYGDEAEQVRHQLHPSLSAFLDQTIGHNDISMPFYFWVEGIAPPTELFAHWELFGVPDGPEGDADTTDAPNPRMVTLYTTNIGLGGGHTAGLIYDQVRHKATVALGVEDFGFIWPINEQLQNQNLWHPLETVLTNWIEMIRRGKITASHLEDDDHPEESENERFGPWGWKSYAPDQVDSTVRAFDRLVDAIEQRNPTSSSVGGSSFPTTTTTTTRPLLSDADLDVALVPLGCFIRSFLTRIRAPKFRFIAPGLMVPLNAAAFAESQTFTRMDTTDDGGENGVVIPPVLLFSAEDGNTVSFDGADRYQNRNPFCRPFQDGLAPGVRVPAGLYSESVERGSVDNAEEGFRLVLPFTLRDGEGEEEEEGEEGRGGKARKSDGQLVEVDSLTDLFQHGYKPFGGEWWRAQRLERLFEHWTGLVESGAWAVGPNGVEGGLGKFEEAKGGRWRNYWIAPSW